MRYQRGLKNRTLTPLCVGSNPAIPTSVPLDLIRMRFSGISLFIPCLEKTISLNLDKIKAVRKDSFYFGGKRSARSALKALRFALQKRSHSRGGSLNIMVIYFDEHYFSMICFLNLYY